MFEKLGHIVLRLRWATLVVSGLIITGALVLLFHGGRLSSGTFTGLEYDRADQLVARVSGHSPNLTFVAVFHAKDPSASPADLAASMTQALAPVRANPAVASVLTPDEVPAPDDLRMVNQAAGTRIALVTLRGTFAEALKNYPSVRAEIVAPDAEVTCTGHLPFMNDMNKTLEGDLIRAELIAIPLALLVLLFVFRTVVAASLPVGVGALAVLAGVGVVFGISHVTDVAMYSINVCSLIGLGVSIDYSLFFVSRYREELALGRSTNDAIVKTMGTAGHVVASSGLAVCTGLAGLFFFAGSYLLPMGVAGVVVVALAVFFALTFLPSMLSLLGPRINALRIPIARKESDGDFWHRLAHAVMKRPLAVGIPTLGVLLLMGVPFLHVRLASADVSVLDRTVEARRGLDQLARDLPDQAKNRIIVGVDFPSGEPTLTEARVDALSALADRAAALPDVSGVESMFKVQGPVPASVYKAMLLHPPAEYASQIEMGKAMEVGDGVVSMTVLTDAAPDSEKARAIVRALRSERTVADGQLIVGGDTAKDLDATRFIASRTVPAICFVVGVTLLFLFFVFRSVMLPIKAVIMTILSMAGSFGALVFIFQDGHFGVTEPRPLEPTLPVLLFCVLFGLSMDYEVLLLSRVKEAYERTGDNTFAVAEGMQKTARLITSAAAIMVAVFAAFAFAHVVMIQAVGVGMALAVAVDATLVRCLLVPATMRLMGRLNWWAPKFARKNRRETGSVPPLIEGRARTSHA